MLYNGAGKESSVITLRCVTVCLVSLIKSCLADRYLQPSATALCFVFAETQEVNIFQAQHDTIAID